MLKARDLS